MKQKPFKRKRQERACLPALKAPLYCLLKRSPLEERLPLTASLLRLKALFKRQ
jgi:hypothetical protein